MSKKIIELCFVVFIFVHYSICNEELEIKISKMQDYVNNIKLKLETRRNIVAEHEVQDLMVNMRLMVAQKLSEYFNQVEQEARKLGHLENQQIDAVYYRVTYEEIKELNITNRLKQIVKDKVPEDSWEELNQFLDDASTLYKKCMEDLIHEYEKHPQDIFHKKSTQDFIEDMAGPDRVVRECAVNYENAKNEATVKLHDKGKTEEAIREYFDHISLEL